MKLIAVGNLKETYLRNMQEKFIKNIPDFTLTELKAEPVKDNVLKALDIEAERILKRISPNEYVVLCDLAGKKVTEDLIKRDLKFENVTFVIGSSYGLSEKVKRRADVRYNFSNMTFPHQLFRMVLLEILSNIALER